MQTRARIYLDLCVQRRHYSSRPWSEPLQNAQSAAGTAREQVRKITPDQLPDAARKTAAAAWRRRAPLAVTVGVIVLACLAVIGRRRR